MNLQLTHPKISGAIQDTNSNELLDFAATASAVNHFQLVNGATGQTPQIYATGSDTNVGIWVQAKGNAGISLANGGANYTHISGALSGSAPTIAATGSDTNVDLNLRGKGTGVVTIGTSGIEVASISSTQTLSNKTIGNTNTITVADANFTIQDDSDTTKQAKFQASGITIGTTRTLTIPDANGTIALTADVENSPRELLWNGSSWPDRPNDSRPTIFAGETTTAPSDADLEVGDIWVYPEDIVFSELSGVTKDEDNMVSDSATHLPTQQSVKAYVDSHSSLTAAHGATGAVVGTTNTQTLTNKRINPRINSTASSATPAINVDTTDQFNITALAADITSMTTNLTGTPVDGQKLMIRIKDNGTARAITWGASFQSSGVATLLATTAISKTHHIGLIYDSVVAKWVCIAVDVAGY